MPSKGGVETVSSNLDLLQPAGKNREGYRGYSSPKRQDSGGSSTLLQHGMKGPAKPVQELLPAGVVTPGWRISLTNTQGRWLLLFHNPQGLEDPQDFRAEVKSTDFMFSWYLVRVYISQDQKPLRHWQQSSSILLWDIPVLSHRNPAVLWFKNSKELESKPFLWKSEL